jgi:hypothetical protein
MQPRPRWPGWQDIVSVLRERLSHMPGGWEGRQQYADLPDIALLREARTHEMIAKFDRPAGYDTTNLVVEHVEAKGGLRLRLAIQLSLKGPDFL